MEFIIFIIPFITALILLLFFRKQTVWWEYMVVILPSLLVALCLECIFKSGNCQDKEYLGSYITSIRYYEAWDEWIVRTCTREVPSGTDSEGHTTYTTEVYDCSYCDEHPEHWTYVASNGREEYFYNKEDFERVCKRFNVSPQFVDMNRDYYTKDGDMYEWQWDGTITKSYTLTDTHIYNNPIKASRSIFKFEDISKEEAHKLGLYDYHDVGRYDQSPIYGLKFPTYQEQYIRWLNGRYGKEKQIRLNLLFFKNKGEGIAEKQRSYWEGGNKNEVTCCIGIDNHHKVTWVRCFSWEDKPVITVEMENWFLTHKLNLKSFYYHIQPIISKEWKRKEFKDFDYLSIEISDGEYIFILIVILLYNVGVSVWAVLNDFRNDNLDNSEDMISFKKNNVKQERYRNCRFFPNEW